MKRFLKRYWKVLVAVIIVIVVIIIIVAIVKGISNSKVPGKTGIIKIDGKTIGVFEDKKEAQLNQFTLEAEKHELVVSGSKKTRVETTVGIFPNNSLVTDGQKKNHYDMNLENIGDQTEVLLNIKIGGDGSFFGNMLDYDTDNYYLVVIVANNNPSNNDSNTSTDGSSDSSNGNPATNAPQFSTPTGKVFIEETSYNTYPDEKTSADNCQCTLPTYMLKDGLTFRAEHSEDTARIWATISMVDDEDCYRPNGIRMNADSNWTATLDISNINGHKVTIMLKYEDSKAICTKYEYITVILPEID
jgi:hypothetical protein